jgi:hypothetical protein
MPTGPVLVRSVLSQAAGRRWDGLFFLDTPDWCGGVQCIFRTADLRALVLHRLGCSRWHLAVDRGDWSATDGR